MSPTEMSDDAPEPTITQVHALIFDFGGVLTTNVWSSFETFCRDEGIGAATVRELFKRDPEALADLRGLETGALSDDEFERRFAARLEVEPEGLIRRLFSHLDPEPRMIDAVRAARSAGVATGLISNSWGGTTHENAPLDELFDEIVISGDVGLHKPQPEIYLLATQRLGVEAAACVFVDDLRENCEGAERVGMTAVLHRDPEETIARLQELLGRALG